MLKVNLERELIKQNKSVVSAKELLLLREYDTVGEDNDENALKRVFGNVPALEGKSLKIKIGHLAAQTLKYEQGRVFHVSQIEKLCKKYHLRFLSSAFYRGSIDKDTASKIAQFEIAYGVACRSEMYAPSNTFIAAPAVSFKLERRPKDPLLFYQINEQYYFLIHKWGNDLSIVRRLYRALSSKLLCAVLIALPSALWASTLPLTFDADGEPVGGDANLCMWLIFLSVVSFCFCLLFNVRFANKNNWNSHYLD